VHFSVADTGIGIPPEKLDAIFDPFEQADVSTTRKHGGTGLGLTISSRLVELMKGRLWVESEVGRGSTFHFTAWLGWQRDVPPAPHLRPSEPLHNLPVLVVDDNATNRRILEEMLRSWDMAPTVVENGACALAELDRARAMGRPFALVLLDAMMPQMDGFALAEQIQGRPELDGTIVMMLSSADRQGEAARCRTLGLACYLTKPIKQSDLLDAILTARGAPPVRERKPEGLGTDGEAAPRVVRHLRVLLAEDNPVNQKLASQLLKKQGHAVTIATNGKEALAALERQAFDLVLMDLQMPEMDGFETTAAIRAGVANTSRRIPVVALTAHVMKGDRERCLEAGMDAYLSKPLRGKDLCETIARLFPAPEPADQVLDAAALLASLGQDVEMRAQLVEVFLDECPRLMLQIREAIGRKDRKTLQHAAHALKGSTYVFFARPASEAAQQLELRARAADWADMDEVQSCLDREIKRLESALATLIPETPVERASN
jgi:CheY-like chemotaxis protein/HPt (histidine-containing phosphotransfer) domain-containing protein